MTMRTKQYRGGRKLWQTPLRYPDKTYIVIALWRDKGRIVASDMWETFRLSHEWGQPMNRYPAWLAEVCACYGVRIADGALYAVRGADETVRMLACRVASAAQRLAQAAWDQAKTTGGQ